MYRKDKVQDVITINFYLIAIVFSLATLVALIWVATQLGKVWLWLTNFVTTVVHLTRCGFSKSGVVSAKTALTSGDKK